MNRGLELEISDKILTKHAKGIGFNLQNHKNKQRTVKGRQYI